MNVSRDSGTPSILLWCPLSNLLSIGGILAKGTLMQLESKLLAAFTMVFLPLTCYISALVSLRSKRIWGAHINPPRSWNRTWLMGWGILSFIATVQRYLVVVLYMGDALSNSNGRSHRPNAALAICCVGLFEACTILCIAAICWRNTVTSLDELPTSVRGMYLFLSFAKYVCR